MMKTVPPVQTIVSAFRDTALKFPSNVALSHLGEDISYSDLDARSERLARVLRACDVQAGSLVGVFQVPGPDPIIAILAILKVGAGYLPLSASYPPERLRLIARQAGLKFVVGDVAALRDTDVRLISHNEALQDDQAPVFHAGKAEDVAYVMYTSGTTGVPKGVVVPHRAVLRLAVGQNFMQLGPDERILQNSPIAFDAATLEIWGALLNGGTLVLPEENETGSLRGLGAVLERERITTLWLTAGLFHAMAEERPEDFGGLRQLLTGGDVVSPVKAAQVLEACPDLILVNGYGPTENTTFTCCYTISRETAETGQAIPIGYPLRGTDIHILDEHLQPVAAGETGELCASGLGLALGYLEQPDLTKEVFVPAPWDEGLILYRTGDLVHQDEAGRIHYHGRSDMQVKVRGFRVELGEIETALEKYDGIKTAAVVARPGSDGADKQLIGYFTAGQPCDEHKVRAALAEHLPDYAVPTHFMQLDRLPVNDNGKVDRKALVARSLADTESDPSRISGKPEDDLEDKIAGHLEGILDAVELNRTANFFDLGASSLHIARLHERLCREVGREFPISDFFLHPTIADMAVHLAAPEADTGLFRQRPDQEPEAQSGLIAIVGLAGRFPGAGDVETFWDKLVAGEEMISHFRPEDLEIDPSEENPDIPFVASRGVMEGADLFDARHFGIPPREAERLDPQHRILLEVAQTALEKAGYDSDRFDGPIGIFAGCSQNSYLLNNLMSAPGASGQFAAGYPVQDFATLFGNDKDFIATRVAYKLGLTGPAVNVQCACSTSLVAVSQACESLLRGTSDMALAGGVSVTFPSRRPYAYLPDGMASADGHCRTFDANATGTVFGDGAALVVLRRLEDALEAGDDIVAVIRGYAVNNDGSDKAGYAAPSIRAQAAVIRAAHEAAGISSRTIGYVEAHGTATPLGDPIEFAALKEAFEAGTEDTGFCWLGSAKTNVGHLDIAAGVTGLVKTALTLKHGVIPPLLHYAAPNPQINFAASPFSPVSELTSWDQGETPRRAGVSAFGVGGTNIHMVLEEAPEKEDISTTSAEPGPRIFPVSASSPAALKAAIAQLGDWAGTHPDADQDAILAVLRQGRRLYDQRAVLVADGMAELQSAAVQFSGKGATVGRNSKMAFLFPGQGAQHVGMARDLYEAEPVFREALNLCNSLLEPELGTSLLDIVYTASDQDLATEKLKNTALAQPAIFSIGYALAKQWGAWGISPDVMVGHSIGEFAAATVAGVMELPDALKLIAHRGRLMAGLPPGVMLSVRASEEEILPFLNAGLDLAAINGTKACVLAGPEEAAEVIVPQLEAAGIVSSRLHTSHAFHSHMMTPALEPFREAVAQMTLRAPSIPILSTVTGDWLTGSEATDPDYWAQHMRRPVRLLEALQVLWAEKRHILIETGPGRTMATLAGQNPDRKHKQPTLASLPSAQAEGANAHHSMLSAFGGLWAHGYPVDWTRIDNGRPMARRMPGLPTYPFQRKRFWVEPSKAVLADVTETGPVETTDDPQPLPPANATQALVELLSELSGLDPEEIDPEASFLELGFDSLLLTQAIRELSERFSIAVTLRQLIDGFPSVGALADHIKTHGNLSGAAPRDQVPLAEVTRIEAGPRTDSTEAPDTSAPVTRIAKTREALTAGQQAHIDALVARFTAKTARSKALTESYRPVHADPRTASGFNQLWKELVYQIVTVKSKGSRLIDVDGNEYVDILNGFGPGFLGHSPDFVTEAIQQQLGQGFEVGPQSLVAMEAAQLFCDVTGNERASFVCTGSEAVYAAMRLARTVTNRDKVVMFARDYHGNFDEVLVRGIEGRDGPRTLPLAPGIPRDAVRNVVVLPYGSSQALDYIRRNADELAAVIVEPVQSRRPEFRPAEFIRETRRITEKAGALFIFDEVVTGFRFGPRGAQAYYNVDADLVTYGKVVGGGMPVGVVSGKARYMDTFDGGQWFYGDDSFPEAPVTFFAGTFVRHPLAMASLRTMLTFFKSQPDFFWKTVNVKGDRLAGTIDRWFEDNDMPFQMPNCGSLMYLRIAEDQKFGALLGAHMRDRGVFLLEGFPSYMTAAHDDEDIDHVIAAFQDSALEMRSAGLLIGRETGLTDAPSISAAPPRLSLPGGEKAIAKAMNAPLAPVTVPTTEAQREIWAAMIVTPEVAAAYNESVTLKLRGEIDRNAMVQAVKRCLQRHDALRSTFSEDGLHMQVHPDSTVDIGLRDFSGLPGEASQEALQALLDSHVHEPFDMESGPFVRVDLVRLDALHHHLVITAHHIVCDGWSIDVIVRDLGLIYTALIEGRTPSLPPSQSILDYAQAETEWARSEEASTDRDYWLAQFAELPPALDLPTDHPRPVMRSVAARRCDTVLEPDLVRKLRQTAANQGSTLVNLLLAAFKLYLARVSGVDDVTVGMPAAGQAARNMQQVVGHCVNLMPLRSHVDRTGTFPEFLKSVQTTLLDGLDHQHFTFGALVRERRLERELGRLPITSVMFNIDNGIDLSDMHFGAAEASFVSNPRAFENFEIFLNLADHTDSISAEWTYNSDIFDVDTIEGHIAGFAGLLLRIANKPDATLADLIAPFPSELRALQNVSESGRTDYPAQPIHALVAAKAVAQPNAPAVVGPNGEVATYEDLNSTANQIAATLLARGLQVGDRVAVCVTRGPALIASLLGVLKARGAYVPLDPDFPQDRLNYIVGDSGAEQLLHDATTGLVVKSLSTTAQCLNLDGDLELISSYPTADPEIYVAADDLAYVLYTSGSTGRPKGVSVSHRAFVNFITSMIESPGISAGDRLLAVTTVSFDISGLEMWGPLVCGAQVIVAGTESVADAERLQSLLDEHDISILQATPSTWRLLVDGGWSGRKELKALVGGEKLPPDLAGSLLKRCASVWNMYGPTETTVWSVIRHLQPGERVAIGRPIANTEVLVLDPELNPLPPGVTGELFIGGDGLAEGYHNQAALTAERFIPHPDKHEARLYRTGDLARWIKAPDGGYELDCLGRTDTQVKLRGYRIELGEIESRLTEHPDVAQAVVLLREIAQNDRRLIAYVSGVRDQSPDPQDIRMWLQAGLPGYMLPARIEVLAELPLTPNGKIDRKHLETLPLADEASELNEEATASEQRLLRLFRDVLTFENIGLDDSFFELGGHSLLAVRLFAGIRSEFGVQLPITTLFANPSVRQLARELGAPLSVAADSPAVLPAGNPRLSSLTTDGQREIFGALLFYPEQSLSYNLPFGLSIRGPLDREALLSAIRDLVARHDALRANFDADGEMMIFADPDTDFETRQSDLSSLDEEKRRAQLNAFRAEAGEIRFDLRKGPLFSARLVQLAPDQHELIMVTHHIVCDGWSINILLRDLQALYLHKTGEGPSLDPAQSIADLASSEARWRESKQAALDLTYWKKVFSGTLPVMSLPTDRPHSAKKSPAGAQFRTSLGEMLTERLRIVARKCDATLENLIFTAFNVFISRLMQSEDVVIGMPSSGQLAHGLENAVGHSVNFLPIRNKVSLPEKFSTLLSRVRRNQLEVLEHKRLTYGTLLRELRVPRDPGKIPLVPIAMSFDNLMDEEALYFPDTETDLLWYERPFEHFELFVYVTTGRRNVPLEWSFSTDLFDQSTISRYADEFIQLLEAICEAPECPVGDLSLLPEETRHTLLETWQGANVDYPREETLNQLFATQVEARPKACAVVEQGREISYKDLDQQANAIACRLIDRGVTAGDTVGVCVERSALMIAGMLAVMRIGAAYVPLDPSNPAERLQYIARDAKVRAILLDDTVQNLPEFRNTVSLDDIGEDEIQAASPVSGGGIGPESIAYVAYTSGSTGKPKGVMGTHRAALNRFAWMWREFPFSDDEVMCQKTSISFVDSVWEIFGPLLAGIPQVIIDKDTVVNPGAFLAALAEHHVTRLLVVPSLLKALLEAGTKFNEAVPSLRWLFTSGERIPAELATRILKSAPDLKLVNLYGSSEVAADVTYEIVESIEAGDVPIGRPIDNARLYVLDKNRQLVSPGAVGELFVGGDVLAAGYLHRPDLTNERFIRDPFSPQPTARMFATGDLVCHLPDGRLLFKGRSDHQVKIRGARVELGEVEAALLDNSTVSEAAVILQTDPTGEAALAAFVVGARRERLDSQSVREALRQVVPDYMVPAHITVLDALPLNSSGKIDRPALEAYQENETSGLLVTAAISADEQTMRQIWTQVMGLENIDPEDDFFALGGHSLMAVKLFTHIRRRFGVELPISALLNYPTIRTLTKHVLTSASKTGSHTGVPEDSPWDTTVVIHAGPGNGRRPLFIAGGIGGNVNNLFELGGHIGRDRPLIGLQTRGILGHKAHETIEASAADHLTHIRKHQPEGPYLLAGYSGGAFVAYEMALQLKAAGETAEFLGILDMSAPGYSVDLKIPHHTRLRIEIQSLIENGVGTFISRLTPLLREKLTPNWLLEGVIRLNPDAMRLTRLRRHWWKIAAKYDPAAYDGSTWLFLTEDNGFVATMMRNADPEFGWRRLLKGEVRIARHTVGHIDMLAGDDVQYLAAQMRAEINKNE